MISFIDKESQYKIDLSEGLNLEYIFKVGNKVMLYLPQVKCQRALTYKEVEKLMEQAEYRATLIVEHTEEIEKGIAKKLFSKLREKAVPIYVYTEKITKEELEGLVDLCDICTSDKTEIEELVYQSTDTEHSAVKGIEREDNLGLGLGLDLDLDLDIDLVSVPGSGSVSGSTTETGTGTGIDTETALLEHISSTNIDINTEVKTEAEVEADVKTKEVEVEVENEKDNRVLGKYGKDSLSEKNLNLNKEDAEENEDICVSVDTDNKTTTTTTTNNNNNNNTEIELEFKRLNAEIDSLHQQLDRARVSEKDLSEKIKEYEEYKKRSESERGSERGSIKEEEEKQQKEQQIQIQIQLQQQIQRKEKEVASLKFELERIGKQLSDSDAKVSGLETKISLLTEDNRDLEERLTEETTARKKAVAQLDIFQENRVELKTKLDRANKEIDSLRDSLNELNNKLERIESEKKGLEERYEKEKDRVKKSSEEIKELRVSLTEAKNIGERNVREAVKELEDRNKYLEERESRYTDLENENIQLKESKAKIQNDYESISVYKVEQEASLNEAKKELELAKKEIDSLASEKEVIETQKKEAEERVSQLEIKLQEQLDDIRAVANAKTSISKIQNENTKLKESVAYYKQLAGQAGNMVCKYTGQAKIIAVIGTGSYGVSNITASIAKSLTLGNVLVMDFDLDSPKLDKYMQKNPILELDLQEPMQRTSLGYYLAKGVDSTNTSILEDIVQNVETRQVKRLDYFSGLYAPELLPKLITSDIGGLLTAYATKYDYIIIDLGKLGMSNSLTDIVVTSILRASTVPLVVTQNEVSDVRGMCLKLAHYGFALDSVYWVLNRSKTNVVNPNVSKLIKKAKKDVITLDIGVTGNKTLDRVPVPNGQLGKILDNIAEWK